MKDFTRCGICSNCGNCCSDILHLDEMEIKKIDNYLKEHKVLQHHKEKNDMTCPFRNELLKKCDIYEVRPQICQVFKCNIAPQEAFKNRDDINLNKKPRSMTQLFFNDNSKIKFIKDNFKLKVYNRGE